MQGRWIHTCTIQTTISDCVEYGDGWTYTMGWSTSHIILNTELLMDFTRIINGVLKHRDEGSSHGWWWGQSGILNGLTHEEVQVRHVRKMLVGVLSICKGRVASICQLPKLFFGRYVMWIRDGRVVESCMLQIRLSSLYTCWVREQHQKFFSRDIISQSFQLWTSKTELELSLPFFRFNRYIFRLSQVLKSTKTR